MIDPLNIPSTLVDALATLADGAKRLPELGSRLDERAERLEGDISAMREATERLSAIAETVASIEAP